MCICLHECLCILFCTKAIQLEQAIQKDNVQEFTQSLHSYYQLKYGTTCPNLSRMDSTLRRATVSSKGATRAKTVTQSLGSAATITNTHTPLLHSSSATLPSYPSNQPMTTTDEDGIYYLEMIDNSQQAHAAQDTSDDDDDNGYTFMFHGKNADIKFGGSKSTGNGDIAYKDTEPGIQFTLVLLFT